MSRSKHQPTATCASCTTPVRDATLCAGCLASIATDLGDIAALVHELPRVFTSDDRDKGSDTEPLIRSRPRRLVPVIRRRAGGLFCVLHPGTGKAMLEPEPLPRGGFGRGSSSRWDAGHGLGHEIDATVARQTATGRREGARASTTPLPFNDRAALVARRVYATLDRIVRRLHDGVEPWPRADVVAAADWLQSRADRIGRHASAGQIDRDVRRVVEDLRRAVDRPADRWFMGPCDTAGCVEEQMLVNDDGTSRVEKRPTELYAVAGAETVRCPRCEAEYPIVDRRIWLLAAAEDQLAHAELIGRAAPALGIEITPSSVRNYADRGRIVAHGLDLHGRPLYRVGDVIAVAQEVLAKRVSGGRHAGSTRSA